MLIELLQPGGAEICRRWVAALLLVPRDEREGVVREVEKRIAEAYVRGDPLLRTPEADARSSTVRVIHDPVQREGYVEQIEVEYSRGEEPRPSARSRRAEGH